MKCFISAFDVRRRTWNVRILIFLLLTSYVPLSTALACALCKDALTPGMAKGFYWSILVMLSVPMVVVAVIAGAIWRAGLKRRGFPSTHHGRFS